MLGDGELLLSSGLERRPLSEVDDGFGLVSEGFADTLFNVEGPLAVELERL